MVVHIFSLKELVKTNAIRVAMQSHADSMVKHARDCIERRITLQLCLYTIVMLRHVEVVVFLNNCVNPSVKRVV